MDENDKSCISSLNSFDFEDKPPDEELLGTEPEEVMEIR